MRYTVVQSIAQVIGKGWCSQPITQEIKLSTYDLRNMQVEMDQLNFSEEEPENPQWTRDSVERWLLLHLTGDFMVVDDFRVEIEWGSQTITFDWEKEDSEIDFYDSMTADMEGAA